LRVLGILARYAPDLQGPLALALVLVGVDAAFRWPKSCRLTLLVAAAGAAIAMELGPCRPDALTAVALSCTRSQTTMDVFIAVALLCALPFGLASRSGARRVQSALVGLGLLWAACGAAACALIPSALLLDGQPLKSGASWPTVVVLTLLSTALSVRMLRTPAVRAFFAEREDRRIFAIYSAMMAGAIGAAVMLTAVLLTVRTIEGILPLLHQSVRKEALALDQVMNLVTEATDFSADQLAPTPAGRAGRATSDGDLQLWLDMLQHRLEPIGQIGIELTGFSPEPLARGRIEDGPWLQLNDSGKGRISIGRRHGWSVQQERPIRERPGARLVVQALPLDESAQLRPFEVQGSSAIVMLCTRSGSADAVCLTKGSPAGLRVQLAAGADRAEWPLTRAWRGLDGAALLRGSDGIAQMVAYAAVGRSGLGLLQRIPLTELMHGIDETVLYLLAGLLALGTSGLGLLYAATFPGLRELRYAKSQVEATLANLPSGVLTLEAGGRVRSSNVGARKLFSRSADDLLGRDIATLLNTANPNGGDGSPWHPISGVGEAQLRRQDGTVVPIETLVESFEFEGRPRWVLILRDLRRELAHRKQLEHWEQIFIHSGWGVAASSSKECMLDQLNPAFAQMHGYDVRQLVHQPLATVVAPESGPELARQLELLGSRGHISFDAVHQRRDGSRFPVLIDLASAPEEAGHPGYWVVNVQDMTERKRIQDAIQRSEALLKLVLQSLPVGVWIADRDGRVTSTNPAVKRLWNRDVVLVDGRPVTSDAYRVETGRPVLPDDYPMMRAIRTGSASLAELIEIRCEDGSHRMLLTSSIPLVGVDGAIEGAISVNEDVTPMRRAQVAIMEARNFFEGLFRSAAMGMAVWNVDGRFERVNQALCELLARTEASLLSSTLEDVSVPEFVDADRDLMSGMGDGTVDKVEVERSWRRGDGRTVWVLMVASLVRIPDAEEAKIVAQIVDIDSGRRFRQALQASEARLRNANHIARLADWEWNLAADEVYLSEEGWHMLGLAAPRDGLIRGEQWFELVHPDDLPGFKLALEAAGRGAQMLAIDYRLQSADGAERVFHQQAQPVIEGDPGARPRLVGVLQDITERKRVENELLESRQRLRERSANEEALIEQERRHIAREVHDELGQSLTALKMELSLLRQRLGGQPALDQRVARIISMVESTIDVVRHVASNLRPSALDFGLVAAIEWLAEDFSLRWEIPCDVLVDSPDVSIGDGPATALFRIVQESLTNIARHAGASRVEIRLHRDDCTLHLAICDDGIGFDLVHPRHEGNGFGLLGMRERALNIGARLTIESQPGAGTRIRIELPLTAH
jgi:PAS domain S-box-containing protein